MVCVPQDFPVDDAAACDGLLSVLRVEAPQGSRTLTHRDYLGSMLGLGIDRNVTGDILVRPSGADIIVLTEMAEFLLAEYKKVGRVDIKTSIVTPAELIVPEQQREIIKDTIPSLRLDNIVSAAFRISRSNATEAIKSGLVSVNHVEQTKPDAKVDEGSAIVLRGKGKAVLAEVGGESKKGRTWVAIERYL